MAPLCTLLLYTAFPFLILLTYLIPLPPSFFQVFIHNLSFHLLYVIPWSLIQRLCLYTLITPHSLAPFSFFAKLNHLSSHNEDLPCYLWAGPRSTNIRKGAHTSLGWRALALPRFLTLWNGLWCEQCNWDQFWHRFWYHCISKFRAELYLSSLVQHNINHIVVSLHELIASSL